MDRERLVLVGLDEHERAIVTLAADGRWAISEDVDDIGPDTFAVVVAEEDEVRLHELRVWHPTAVRIRLCDATTATRAATTGGVAHEYLLRPIREVGAEGVLDRAVQLRELLADEQIRGLAAQLGTLPALPRTYQALCAVLVSDTATVGDAAEVIARDVAVSSRVLRLVNSALYAMPRRVVSLEHAVGLLGLRMVRDLVLAVEVFGELRSVRPSIDEALTRLQDQAHATGTLARVLVRRNERDVAYTTGLLAHVGRMLLMAQAPERYIACLYMEESGIHLDVAEQEVFGVRSRDVGAWLLAVWGLPWDVVEAVRNSDSVPWPDGGPLPMVGAVHLAGCLVEEAVAAEEDEPLVILTQSMLEPWGLERRAALLRQLARTLVTGPGEPPVQTAAWRHKPPARMAG